MENRKRVLQTIVPHVSKGTYKEEIEILMITQEHFIILQMSLYLMRIACGLEEFNFFKEVKKACRQEVKNADRNYTKGLHKMLKVVQNESAFSFDENEMPTVVSNLEIKGVNLDCFLDVLQFLGFAVSIILNIY